MISVIISSANNVLLQQVSKNITDTIGVAHEVIVIDNSDGQKGICAVYNQGIKQAKYNILCFMHEDVAMVTSNWGIVVQSIFLDNKDIGLIGVAGNSYKPLTPTGNVGNASYYLNLIQAYKFSDTPKKHDYNNPEGKSLVPVASVDGVWFCTTRQLALKHTFDELLNGFHGYDIDFSLSIGREKTVAVTFDILLEHFSEGRYNQSWLKEIVKIHEKWYSVLPVKAGLFTKQQTLSIERKCFKHFITQVAQSDLSMKVANHFLWKDNRFFKLSPVLFIKLQFYVLVAWIRKAAIGGNPK